MRTTTTIKTSLQDAAAVADRCADAYSFDYFGPDEWREAARMMARRGFDVREIEAVLRSKWTRWSRDAEASAFGIGTAQGLADFLDNQKDTPKHLRSLVAETFGEDLPTDPGARSLQHDAVPENVGRRTADHARRCPATEVSRSGRRPCSRQCTKTVGHEGDCAFAGWVLL